MTTALMGSVAFVLLIVCANVGTLFLLRSAMRRRELAVRSAIGATARRLTVLVLSEVLVLTAAGAVLGAAAAAWAVRQARSSWSDQLPYRVQLEPDHRMLWFVVAASGITAAVIALFAVFGATRQNLSATLAENAGRITLSRRTQRTRAGLAAAQIALSLALLVGAHLLIGSFLALQKADLGFSSDRFLAARVNLSGDAFDSTHARAAYVDAAVRAIGSEPGVAAVAATSSVPGVDAGGTVRLVTDVMDGDDHIEAQSIAVTSQFADALGLAVIDGRAFTASEQADPDGAGGDAQRATGRQAVEGRVSGRQAHRHPRRTDGQLDAHRRRDAGRRIWPGWACHGADTVASVCALRPLRCQGDGLCRPRVRRSRVAARAGSPDASPGTRGNTGVRRPDDTREQARRQPRSGVRRHRDGGAGGDESPAGEPWCVWPRRGQRAPARAGNGRPTCPGRARRRTIIWLLLNQARRSGIAGVVLGLALAIAVAGTLARQPGCRPGVRADDVRECGRDSARRRHGSRRTCRRDERLTPIPG